MSFIHTFVENFKGVLKTRLFFVAGLVCFSLFVSAQHVSPMSVFNEAHARQHLEEAGYAGAALDSMLTLSRERRLARMNARPEYHPFGDERDSRSSMPGFDCENDNWGFEEGDLSGWTTNGSVYLIDSGVDPYGQYPWLYPAGGDFSVRLMSDNSYGDFAQLSRQINVPATGRTFFSFHFAMSILNMDHSSYEASRFNVRLYNQSGEELPCPTFTCFYSTDLGPQGVDSFEQTADLAYAYNPGASEANYSVTYSDWKDVTLDLTTYAGQSLTVEFSASYCIYDPHWCYALIDVDCPVNSGDVQLQCSFPPFYPACGPEGMESYEWTNSQGDIIGTGRCVDVTSAGNFFCEFTSEDVCSGTSQVTLEYLVGPYPDALTSVDENACINEVISFANNSTIDVGTIAGYYWDFGDGTQTSSSAPTHSYVAAGQYDASMVVYSDLGCRDTSHHIINVIPSPVVDFDWTTDCLLPEADMIDLSQASGSPIVGQSWDVLADGSVESVISNPTLSFVGPGTFGVKLSVTDANNCTAQKTKEVVIYDLLDLNPIDQSNFSGYSIDCYGASTGTVTIDAGGGDASYTYYDESGIPISANLSGLSAGIYPFIVEDGRGCRDTLEVQITQPQELTVIADTVSNYNGFPVSCPTSADGQSAALVNGGVGPFQYEWTTGLAGDTSNADLPVGLNYVLVTDANGCVQTYQFNLNAPTALQMALESQSDYNGYNVSCFGLEDGWVDLVGSGGLGGYNFIGATNTNTGLYEGVGSGVQTFTMVDANGCITSLDVNFTEPASIDCNTSITSDYNGYNISCYGFNDAVGITQPNGGVAPFTHSWSNGGDDFMNDSLAVVDSWVMVTDGNNCERMCEFVVTQPDPLVAMVNNIPDTCARSVGSFITTLSGGVAPYTSYWFNHTDSTYTSGSSYTGGEVGVYDLHITDLNGCRKDYTFEKTEVPPAEVSIVRPTRKLCTQEHTKFELETSKGIASHSWSFNDQYYSTQATPEIFFEEAGEVLINVTVLDEHDCMVDTSLVVNLEEGLTMFIPNAITADGDGINDVFGPVASGALQYHCVIVDRWGTTVFESNDPEEKWLGGSLGGAYYNGVDVFNYRIDVVGECEVEKNYQGHITLVR
jgi:hypothetical protein